MRAVPEPSVEDLGDTWGEELLSVEKENSSEFEKQSMICMVLNNAPAIYKIYSFQTKMMEFEPLLEASGERNLLSVNLSHRDYRCHCLAQTVWYPEKSNLCLSY